MYQFFSISIGLVTYIQAIILFFKEASIFDNAIMDG